MRFQSLVRQFQETGLLLLSDKALPNVVGLVAGPKVKGSWWGHERGHEIFGVLKQLEAHPDTLTTRLVSGKVTYLHRRHWPEFLSVATAREIWQTQKLSASARRLLSTAAQAGGFTGGQGETREINRWPKFEIQREREAALATIIYRGSGSLARS